MEKTHKFFVHFWLAVSIASLIYAIFRIAVNGWDAERTNLFIPVVAFCWYLFRRAMYRRLKKQQESGH